LVSYELARRVEKAKRLLEWQSEIPVRDGIGQLICWVRENKRLFDWLK
jgi:hypothetical protein